MTPLALGSGLVLAQGVGDGGADAAIKGLIYLLAFLGVTVFVFVGYSLFSTGWESYEEKYLQGAERTLDDLFLTIPPQQLLWLSLITSFALFVLVFVLTSNAVLGVLLAAPGLLAPKLALQFMKKRRVNRFSEQLVEALITLTNSLRSGFSLPKAFQLVANDMPRPICQEFGILVQELRLGIELEEGLDNMFERVPSRDLQLTATSIAIAQSVGGNLAEVFDKIAYTIRERQRIEGRIDALTAQGRLQGLLVSALPVFLAGAIYMIDPELMAPLWQTWIGWGIILLIVLLEGLGYFFIRKITDIEV